MNSRPNKESSPPHARRFDWLAANWFKMASIVAMCALVWWTAKLLITPQLGGREIALITIILTAASMAVSALVAKMFAESASSKSLRDQGVQIARGIMVLRRQIEALSDWVALKTSTIPDGEFTDLRTAGILEHIEETLSVFRSMTDAALAAIASVIGDALAQYEDIMVQISKLRAEAAQKTTAIESEMARTSSNVEVMRLQARIEEIKGETEKRITQLARTSALPIPEPSALRAVTVQCPNPTCKTNNTFEIRDRLGETALRVCSHCGERFNAHITTGNLVIVRRYSVEPGRTNRTLLEFPRWVPPTVLADLIRIFVSADKRLKAGEKTPLELQAEALRSQEVVAGKINANTVRHFLYTLIKSRAFMFLSGFGFREVYSNEITEDVMLMAYIRAYVWHVRQGGETMGTNTNEVSQRLFGGAFPRATQMLQTELDRTLIRHDVRQTEHSMDEQAGGGGTPSVSKADPPTEAPVLR